MQTCEINKIKRTILASKRKKQGNSKKHFKMVQTTPIQIWGITMEIDFYASIKMDLNTKLREFQFKIIHRIYASDSFVSHFDKSVSKNCIHCKVKNCLVHCLAECQQVKHLWSDFLIWYNNVHETNLCLTSKEIIFGLENHN